MWTLLLMSAAALGMKIHRATDVWQWPSPEGLVHREPEKLYANIPFGFQNMARNNYVTNNLFNKPPGNESLMKIGIPVSNKPEEFGLTENFYLKTDKELWVETDVQTFPWNKIRVDEVIQENEMVRDSNNSIAVHLQPGSHNLTYEFNPPALWKFLKRQSDGVTLLWLLFLLVISTFKFKTKADVKNSIN